MAVVVSLFVRLFVFEDYRIISESMEPNLLTGDLVFVSKYNFSLHIPFSNFELLKFARPTHSSVVAFSRPEAITKTLVKRIVALEGDRVAIINGALRVNGAEAKYRSENGSVFEEMGGISYPILPENSSQNFGPVDVPKGHFFALGDNRIDSADSRQWGPVPFSCLKGKVALVWLSLDKDGHVRGDRMGVRVQ